MKEALEPACALPFQGIRILALSPISGYGGFNTSIHRIRAMMQLGCRVNVVDSATDMESALARLARRVRNRLFRWGLPVRWPDPLHDCERLVTEASKGGWQVVWLEKSLTVGISTLRAVKHLCPHAHLVGFSPDDMNARHNQSRQFLSALPAYDVYVTTKTYNVQELASRGCPRTLFIGNGYDPEAFRPMAVLGDELASYEAEVAFIGSYEQERAKSLLYLAQNGIKVRVWGWNWEAMRERHPNLKLEMKPLFGDAFAKACGAARINLNFLRKINRDQQTTRSVEIPACGGFMLAERTNEHLELFAEGSEAEFFASNDELLAKTKRYLEAPTERAEIARRGLQRCVRSGYRNQDRLRVVLREILGPVSYAHSP